MRMECRKIALRRARAARSAKVARYLAALSKVREQEQTLSMCRVQAFECVDAISIATGHVERQRRLLRSSVMKFEEKYMEDEEDDGDITAHLDDCCSSDFEMTEDFKVLPRDYTDSVNYCPFPMPHQHHRYPHNSTSTTDSVFEYVTQLP